MKALALFWLGWCGWLAEQAEMIVEEWVEPAPVHREEGKRNG